MSGGGAAFSAFACDHPVCHADLVSVVAALQAKGGCPSGGAGQTSPRDVVSALFPSADPASTVGTVTFSQFLPSVVLHLYLRGYDPAASTAAGAGVSPLAGATRHIAASGGGESPAAAGAGAGEGSDCAIERGLRCVADAFYAMAAHSATHSAAHSATASASPSSSSWLRLRLPLADLKQALFGASKEEAVGTELLESRFEELGLTVSPAPKSSDGAPAAAAAATAAADGSSGSASPSSDDGVDIGSFIVGLLGWVGLDAEDDEEVSRERQREESEPDGGALAVAAAAGDDE